MPEKHGWHIRASDFAKNTFNPIRNIVDQLVLKPHPDKKMIALSIGDPTVFGNLRVSDEGIKAVMDSVKSFKYNGYGPSVGYETARAAVARHCSVPHAELEAKDVILCSGCSGALDLCISVLLNPGQTLLVPKPGFPLYKTLAEGLGIRTKYYKLVPDRNWEVDLDDLRSQIDATTAAILVNNPSNPCGSVYSKQHLKDILQVAEENYLPVIADEIYEYFVFAGHEYRPMASLTKQVPILSCGGLTKRFMVPGWRMGWILIYDKNNLLSSEVRAGLVSLTQRIIGSNTIIQGALPGILENTPQSYLDDCLGQVEANAKVGYEKIRKIPGLKPVMPTGAMYMMVGVDMQNFPEFSTDLDLVTRMVSEQSVFCLPGKCFDYPNYVRIVLTVPLAQLEEACDRIAEFCRDHYLPSVPTLKVKVPCLSPAVEQREQLLIKSMVSKINNEHE